MKTRCIALLLCGIASVALIGCGGKSDTDASAPPPVATAPATSAPAAKADGTAAPSGAANVGLNPNYKGSADGGIGGKAK